jgi:hypothetical protein
MKQSLLLFLWMASTKTFLHGIASPRILLEKSGTTTRMIVVIKGKVDEHDEDVGRDDTKPTLRPESPVLTPLDCLTNLVPPRYSSEQQAHLKTIEEVAAALFPAVKVYTSIKQLREELGSFGNTKEFAITTVGTKLCCTNCPEPKYWKNRRDR